MLHWLPESDGKVWRGNVLQKSFACNSSGSNGRVRGAPRNMKSMRPPSVAIVFMTYFHRAREGMAPSASPLDPLLCNINLNFFHQRFLFGFSCRVCLWTMEQLRIQDLPGVLTRKVGVQSYYLVNFFPNLARSKTKIGKIWLFIRVYSQGWGGWEVPCDITGADTGFSRRLLATYYLAKFRRKLHEKKLGCGCCGGGGGLGVSTSKILLCRSRPWCIGPHHTGISCSLWSTYSWQVGGWHTSGMPLCFMLFFRYLFFRASDPLLNLNWPST